MSDLPRGWTSVPLENCVNILDNRRVPVNSDERSKRLGKVPYYGATGQVGWIDDFLFNEELLLIGEDGAPFFDKSKPISYIINGKSWVNNHAHVLRAIAGSTTNQFLKHFLDQFDFHGYVNGTTRLKLNQGAMKKIPVVLPPLNEQKRIVEKLEKLFGRVEAVQARLDKIPTILKRFRQSVLAAACSGKLTADWRESNEINLEIELPGGWKIETVGNVIEDLKYGTSQKSGYETKGVPVLRIPNIGEWFIDPSDLKFADLPTKEFEQLRLKEGDVLLIRSNGSVALVGKTAIVRASEKGFAYAGYLIRLRPNRGKVTPEFFNYVLGSYDVRLQIEIPARSTSGVNNINSTEVKSLSIPVPPLDEQKEIVRRVEELFKFADAVEERYKKAKAHTDKLTQSILAKAFRGELVPQDPTDEPASVLLERIKKKTAVTQKRRPKKNVKGWSDTP